MIQQKYLEKNEYLPDEYILEWATKVVEEANARDIPFRLLGRPLLCSKVDRLLDLIEKEPKSFGWKIRAKVGTKAVVQRGRRGSKVRFPKRGRGDDFDRNGCPKNSRVEGERHPGD